MRLEVRELLFRGKEGMDYLLHCDDHDFHSILYVEAKANTSPDFRYFALSHLMRSMKEDERCGCYDHDLLARFDPKAVAG